MGQGSGTNRKMDTETAFLDDEDALPQGRWNRFLFLAAALMLMTFAVIPLAYQALEFWRGEERAEAERLLVQGLSLARNGQEEEARALFESMRTPEDRYGMALTGLAYLRLRGGDRRGAATLWEQALRLNPGNLFTQVLRRQVLEGAGLDRVDQALEALSREDPTRLATTPETGAPAGSGGVSTQAP